MKMTNSITDNLKPHWMADLMPMMPEKEFNQLKEDISGLGQLEPILIFNGEILDGRHRYRACQELGIEPWVTEFDGGMSLSDVIRSLNVYRRHLTPSQRAMVAAELLKPYEKLAKEKQIEAGGDKKSVSANLPKAIESNIIDITPKVHASELAAKELSVSGRSVRDAKVVLNNGTEDEKEAVKQGKAAVSTTAKVVRERKQEEIKKQAPVKKLNATNDNIKWSKWSWNPVTGCLHDCPYCYARDIANRFDGHFKPAFHADRLQAPASTAIPEHRKNEPGINNIFVCSMADLFGKWIHPSWIEQVINVCEEQPQWNYLFLTKNPDRYLEFHFPENCWLGASATNQKQFDRAIETFSTIDDNIKFLSCEPLNEKIVVEEFTHYETPTNELSCIDWLIIGGRSKNSKMPAFQPEWEWVEELLVSARMVKIPVYFKTNLTVRPEEYPK